MRGRRPSCRSIQELFCTVLLVASVSVLVTYQISKYLPHRQQAELKIQVKGRVDIYRDASFVADPHRGLEGIDVDQPERRGRRRGAPAKSRTGTSVEVFKQLAQLEEDFSGEWLAKPKVALVVGSASMLDRDLSLYRMVLEKAGFTVIVHDGYNSNVVHSNTSQSELPPDSAGDTSWQLLFCLSAEDDATSICKSIGLRKSHQKVNFIPELNGLLWGKDRFCVTTTTSKYIPAIRQSHLAPTCFVLPAQYDDFLAMAAALGNRKKWVFKTLGSGHRAQLQQQVKHRDLERISKSLGLETVVVQEYVDHPLLLFGMPFSVRAFVLVTSLSPLRAYLHTEGIVQYRHDYQRNFIKVAGRTWNLEKLRQHLTQTYSQEAASVAFKNMHSVIVQTLLVAESAADTDVLLNPTKSRKRCTKCFQLLEFNLIFNSSFHPTIVEIIGMPDLHDLTRADSGISGISKNNILRDMVALVTASSPVASDLAKALGELNLDIVISESPCAVPHKLCLSRQDVQYLLAMRREDLNRGGYQLLYPSRDSERYSGLLADLYRYFRKPSRLFRSPDNRRWTGMRTTANLHSILLALARFYHNLDVIDDSYDDLNPPLFSEPRSGASHLVENLYYNNSNAENKYIRQSCSEDKSTMPFLEGIYSEPRLNITPEFSPSITEYYASVPNHVFLVKVWAFAQSCYAEARLDDKYGLSRPSNYTLGLGSNRLSIVVVEVTHTEPWVISTYTVYIERKGPDEGLAEFSADKAHQVCSLTQDCDFQFIRSLPCGLKATHYKTWSALERRVASLPTCGNGYAQGEWLVPCANCSDKSTCHWKTASWQPYDCSHRRILRDHLKKCLAGKQILFIGDSTNRGIMHYLMEKVNDSLTEWDKTHDVKIYNNINRDRTTVSFAYYPQFWLPANQRPVFDKALSQLMKQSKPLENNHNTVLVVGGVHWLATHHLNVILELLKREGLSDIKLIIKSLGAGFHQPVDGLHCLNLQEQRKLLIHNADLVAFAKKHGFDAIETFNMTMARYKDFLQGKCACHFHKVKEMLPSFTQYMQSTGRGGRGQLQDMPILYHVEGDINAIYSEILLNSICDYS